MDVSSMYDDVITELETLGELKDITVREVTYTGGNDFIGSSGTESYVDHLVRGFGQEITDLIRLFGTEYNAGTIFMEILKEGTLITLVENDTWVIVDSITYDILEEPIPFYMGGVHKSWFVKMTRRS